MERKDNELRASGNDGGSPEPVIAGGDSAGTSSAPAGRYYECIFCRRGFSTAQALGGHMNIHRRDRPRIRPAAVPPLMRREEGYHPYSREQWYSPTPAVENYVVYFPESPSSMDSQSPRQRPGAEKERKGEENEVEDMDLELRLGHRRRHEKP